VEDVTNTVHQIINMTKETDKSKDTGRTSHERLVALATKVCTMVRNIFTRITAVIFLIVITITLRHDEALIDLFRPKIFSLHTTRQTKHVSRNYELRGKAISVA
jgi:hypothetical protein